MQLSLVCKAATALESSKNIPVNILVIVSPSQTELLKLQSTLERELWFVVHHATHHAALIRSICVEIGLTVLKDFGVAPSTLAHISHS